MARVAHPAHVSDGCCDPCDRRTDGRCLRGHRAGRRPARARDGVVPDPALTDADSRSPMDSKTAAARPHGGIGFHALPFRIAADR